MKKFIISDIHGVGNIYYSVMGYLDNLAKEEDLTLYINGDLFDRGLESGEVLLDTLERMKKGPFKIEYLGGNHELLLYECFEERKDMLYDATREWFKNGGKITDDSLWDLVGGNRNRLFQIASTIGGLKIYHKFEEKIGNKPIVLVHAKSPINVEYNCPITIANPDFPVYDYVWLREFDPNIPFRIPIGSPNHFTIVGHTPNTSPYGYVYHKDGNYMNIDGGCAPYACGRLEYDHVPLVEVKDEQLRILTFNNNNEIIYGNYFANGVSTSISEDELSNDRKYLNNEFKPKQLRKELY